MFYQSRFVCVIVDLVLSEWCLLVILNSIISTRAVDCLERHVPEVTCCVSIKWDVKLGVLSLVCCHTESYMPLNTFATTYEISRTLSVLLSCDV